MSDKSHRAWADQQYGNVENQELAESVGNHRLRFRSSPFHDESFLFASEDRRHPHDLFPRNDAGLYGISLAVARASCYKHAIERFDEKATHVRPGSGASQISQ